MGCSHSSAADLGGYGYCLECGERVTLKPAMTLREQAAWQFKIAKHHFDRFANPYRKGSAPWRAAHKQNRQWAAARLEAWAALRRLELLEAAHKVAAE
jgi:hypothetical protein